MGGVLLYVGKNSMYFLCAHWIIILVILEIFKIYLSEMTLFITCYIVMIVSLVALKLLLKKYDRFIQ